MLFAFLQAAPAQQGSGWSMIIMLVAMFAIMYFFMIRPQQKKQKEMQNFRNSLTVGQEVVTIGGITGTVVDVKDNKFVLETGADQVRIEFEKWALSSNETAAEAAKVEADKLEAVLAAGDLQRAYTVALAGNYGYDNPVEAVEEAIYNYEMAVRNVAYYEGMMETDDSFDQMVEQWLALVDEAEAAYNEAVAGMAVVNEALHATGEAYIAFAELQDVHDVIPACKA
mgnify:CR=1 FL=1